jgi:hypothetical protein
MNRYNVLRSFIFSLIAHRLADTTSTCHFLGQAPSTLRNQS